MTLPVPRREPRAPGPGDLTKGLNHLPNVSTSAKSQMCRSTATNAGAA